MSQVSGTQREEAAGSAEESRRAQRRPYIHACLMKRAVRVKVSAMTCLTLELELGRHWRLLVKVWDNCTGAIIMEELLLTE